MTNFNFIPDSSTRCMICNGHEAVSQLELWEWMEKFDPPSSEGFMWTSHPNIYRIKNKMSLLSNNPGHSGASFAITIHHLRFIAKHGIQKYREIFY
jgi:hypothetical protein